MRAFDLGTVLREVVESARTLTGARYGAIATIDETGAPKDFVTSGLTADRAHVLPSAQAGFTDTSGDQGVRSGGKRAIYR